ncbi:MAG: NACHT domain-containing protein, partial [Symploca sp. SIO2E6]|nr:NACHT domain-containing protein [Symploca sp. SIO2E6]
MEPVTAWGISLQTALVFKDVLLGLGKGALEDYVKDFFKDCLKGGVESAKAGVLKKALGEALQQFLQIIEEELEFACGLFGNQIRDGYELPVGKFIRNQEVKPLLGQAFAKDCRGIDGKKLGKIWRQEHPTMPAGFDWERVAQQYLREVKRIVKQSPELRGILELEIQEAIEKNTQATAGIIPDFNLKAYQEGLQERYANLNLDSLDTSVYDYREKLKVWQVFIAQNVRECQEFLPQVYEIPKEHQRRLRETNQLAAEVAPEALARHKEVYYKQPVSSILALVNQIWDDDQQRYLVILGEPGSGKSIFLQYLALNWARSPLDNVIELPIPLLIELRTYNRDRNSGECKDLLEFFHKGNVICRLNQHQLQERLKTGQVLVMFDGLDEVFEPKQRDQVITDIHRFTNDYPKVRVIVTSRIIGYKHQRLRDAQFRHFLLQDLDSEQIENFIYRWHELTFTDEADKLRKQERLQRSIDTSKAIAELAGNPLLLTMMAILNRNQELPRDRPELYNQASRVLLHQWDVERKLLEDPRVDPVAIDYKDKQAMLRQIAHFMQAADKGLAGNLIQTDDLERILRDYLQSIEVSNARRVARLLIEQLRGRNFILCFLGGDAYSFVHRTFLEYFCAWEFVWQFQQTQTLSIEELKTEIFGKHWQDQSWHEVLRLIAGMIDPRFTGQVIEYLISQDGEDEKFSNVFLAADCLAEVRNISGITITADKLFEELKGLTDYDLNRDVRQTAVRKIARGWKDESDTLPWLKQQAKSDENGDVRQAAIEEIARGWKDDPDTLPILKQRAQSDDNEWVRYAAVWEIARGWKDNQDTLPIIKQWAQSDESWLVRGIAMQEIVRGWKDEPDTLPLLKKRAQFDENWFVRGLAMKEIVHGWKDDPDVLPWLKQQAQSHESLLVRATVAREIATDWQDETNTLPLLQQWAQSDYYRFVRHTTVEESTHALASLGQDPSDTLFLLQQIVLSNEVNDMRCTAVVELARSWKDDPDTLPLLKHLVQSDKNEDVRCTAIEEIAGGSSFQPPA